MVFDAVSIDEKMDSSSESSGFASAVSIMNRLRVTPVSEQTSEKMGAVGATRSRVAACVFCCRGARSRRTNGSILFERDLKCAATAAAASCSAPLSRPWIRIRASGRRKPTLRGALALLFDRAAALFGTKAAAAERHSATMRRCIFEFALRAATLPLHVAFGPARAARARDPNCGRVGGARRRCEAPSLLYTAS